MPGRPHAAIAPRPSPSDPQPIGRGGAKVIGVAAPTKATGRCWDPAGWVSGVAGQTAHPASQTALRPEALDARVNAGANNAVRKLPEEVA